MKAILCRVFGHLWNPDAAEYYRQYYCDRCGHEENFNDGPSLVHRLTWRWRLWFRDQRHAWSRWWVCSDCGWHCGRHDESVDHLPF